VEEKPSVKLREKKDKKQLFSDKAVMMRQREKQTSVFQFKNLDQTKEYIERNYIVNQNVGHR